MWLTEARKMENQIQSFYSVNLYTVQQILSFHYILLLIVLAKPLSVYQITNLSITDGFFVWHSIHNMNFKLHSKLLKAYSDGQGNPVFA